MKCIAIGCDHRGFALKEQIIPFLQSSGYGYQDFGGYSTEPVDYPDIAGRVGQAVAAGNFDQGILICNTGVGMSIAANKVKGIRAALCCGTFDAARSRQHNDANVLCLSTEAGYESVANIVRTYLASEFEGGRHKRRIDKIMAIEDCPDKD